MKPWKRAYGRAGLLILSAVVALLSIGLTAWACIDGANGPEMAFAKTWGPCRQDIIDFIYQQWDLTDDSWTPAGKQDDCNENLPFAKVINAVVLLSNGPHFQLGGFHDTIDYNDESRSTGSPYHGNFYVRFIEQGSSPNAEADSETGRFAAEDRTNLHCLLFDPNSAFEVLANRASVLVHEAWHHWQHANNYSTDHLNGPTGSCTVSGPGCDYYYFHPPDFQLPDGTLSSQIGDLNKTVVQNNVGIYFHSPYQVQIEFDADIALWANTGLVPFAVRLEAQSIGNAVLSSQFANTAAFTIGAPVPFPVYQLRQNP